MNNPEQTIKSCVAQSNFQLEPFKFKGESLKNDTIKKFEYIDALRGFAILGVVLVHSSQWVSPTSNILSIIALQGARGVQLFYVVSALTLFLSMEARKQQETRPLISFFIRRFFRIAPLFYLAIFVYTLYDGMSARHWAPNGLEWWYIPITAAFMHGWHPETITSVVPGGWTIAVEMTFYLLVPYLFLKLRDIRSTLIALFSSLILSKLSSIIAINYLQPYYSDSQQYLVSNFTFFWIFSQLPVFIIGILLYHIIKKHPHKDNKASLFCLFVSIFLFTTFSTVHTYRNLLPQHFFYGVAFLFFALSLYLWPQKLLVNKITTLIGKLSFSIYLVHFMVLEMMKSIFVNGFILNGNSGFLLAFVLIITLSTSFSFITYNIVELPGINFGKKIIQKL